MCLCALNSVEPNPAKYMLILGITKEPVEQKRIRDDYGPGSVRTSSHFIFHPTAVLNVGAPHASGPYLVWNPTCIYGWVF
jgi:hypothetical protein